VKRAMRLNPHHPEWYWQELGLALYVGGQYTKAIHAFNHIAKLVDFDYAYLAACYVELEDIKKAKSYIDQLPRIKPDASVKYYEKTSYLQYDAGLQRFLNAMGKAGIPE